MQKNNDVIVHNQYENIGQTFSAMTRISMDRERLSDYLKLVFPDPKDTTNERAASRVKTNRSLADTSGIESDVQAQLRGTAGTGFGILLWDSYPWDNE